METPTPVLLPFQAFIFVTQELVKHPAINLVKFIQVSAGPAVVDAKGGDVMSPHRCDEYTKADLAAHKQVHQLPGQVICSWKVYGQFIKPWLPGSGPYFQQFMQELNAGRPLPIQLVLYRVNIDTFEFEAISFGQPLVQVTPTAPVKTPNKLC